MRVMRQGGEGAESARQVARLWIGVQITDSLDVDYQLFSVGGLEGVVRKGVRRAAHNLVGDPAAHDDARACGRCGTSRLASERRSSKWVFA
eukprot:6198472-Pleurochrysis_carterae.AAC.7